MMNFNRRLLLGALGSVAIGLSVSAQAQTALTVQPNWTAGGANAGFAAAVAEGFYKEVGLDVKLVEGNGSGNTAQLAANGRADLAYADAVAVSQLIAKGAPLKVISTVYQSNPNAVLALKKMNIRSPKGLVGKKVGVPAGSSQTTMLPLFLRANGLKESEISLINMPPTSMVPSLLQGQVDAILGSIDAYQIQLEAQGAAVDVYRFADYGVPTVSTSIFATNSFLASSPDITRRFVAASLKGWTFAIDNPERAVRALKTVFPNVNDKLAAQELAAIRPLFCSGGARFIGKAEDSLWAKSQELLSEVKLLPAGQDPKSYYTHDFLPQASAMRACR